MKKGFIFLTTNSVFPMRDLKRKALGDCGDFMEVAQLLAPHERCGGNFLPWKS